VELPAAHGAVAAAAHAVEVLALEALAPPLSRIELELFPLGHLALERRARRKREPLAEPVEQPHDERAAARGAKLQRAVLVHRDATERAMGRKKPPKRVADDLPGGQCIEARHIARRRQRL